MLTTSSTASEVSRKAYRAYGASGGASMPRTAGVLASALHIGHIGPLSGGQLMPHAAQVIRSEEAAMADRSDHSVLHLARQLPGVDMGVYKIE
jgi:hypothetical protein